jgi:hypothetical protein
MHIQAHRFRTHPKSFIWPLAVPSRSFACPYEPGMYHLPMCHALHAFAVPTRLGDFEFGWIGGIGGSLSQSDNRQANYKPISGFPCYLRFVRSLGRTRLSSHSIFWRSSRVQPFPFSLKSYSRRRLAQDGFHTIDRARLVQLHPRHGVCLPSGTCSRDRTSLPYPYP